MPETRVLAGQDISEAHGAVRKLHEQILHGSGTTSTEQITLRVVAVRGPWTIRTALRDYLRDQPQLALDQPAADRLLDNLEQRGLITKDTPVTLSTQGEDLLNRLTATVQDTAARLYDGLSPTTWPWPSAS